MNPNLIFIALALLFWGIGEGVFFNFVPIYLDVGFSLSESQIGLLLGAFGFSMAITHIPAGRLADTFGRRPLIIGAWILGLVSTLLMGITEALPIYLIGMFGYGLTAFVASPLSSYVTAARGEWSVSATLALTSATFNFGMAMGPLLGGWIAENYGMRTSYLAGAFIFFVSTIFVFLIKKQPIDKHDPESPPVSLWNNKRFISFVAVVAFAIFAMYLSQPLSPNFLTSVRKLNLSDAGFIFSAGALGNSLIALAFSRIKPRGGFLLAQALVAIFAFIMWKGAGLPIFMLGYFLLGGFRAARPMFMAQARDLVHESQMGLTYGTMETVASIVFILTPPLAGFLFEIDPFALYPISIGLIVISIIISYIFSPRKEN
ncbi:MAG: MFS transporter [Anaerolineales bacterium]|nr:MFS transporter [Anaerolineales bacterium]MBX3037067.1 MFS transporter [Anaerolineales bacterium]